MSNWQTETKLSLSCRLNNTHACCSKWHCLIILHGCAFALTEVEAPWGGTSKGISATRWPRTSSRHSPSEQKTSVARAAVISLVRALSGPPLNYFARWSCRMAFAALLLLLFLLLLLQRFPSRYEKWLTTIGDVSRSSNKCVCRCRILSRRKYHDLSLPSSLETPLSSLWFASISNRSDSPYQHAADPAVNLRALSYLKFR